MLAQGASFTDAYSSGLAGLGLGLVRIVVRWIYLYSLLCIFQIGLRIGNSSAQVNLFSATMPEVDPIFIFESMKKTSLRLSQACIGSNFLKTRPTPNPTHSPSQSEAKISFHQATR